MKNILLLLFLFWFSSAVGQSRELKFDNQHTIFKVPKGKEWHLNLEEINKEHIKQIIIGGWSLDKTIDLIPTPLKKIITQESIGMNLQPGENFILTVTEYDAQPQHSEMKIKELDGFRKDCCPLLEQEKTWP
ncbi:MAG: hypothetical protein AB7G44_00160 [Bacteroidia bacterium]